MIDEPRLLAGLVRLLDKTQDNIRRRCNDDAAVNQPLHERYDAARKAGRTGLTFDVWREGEITQAGVAWLLACVFMRFLEDNDLLGEIYLAGPGGRTKAAQERQRLWYRAHPLLVDRDYLLDIFSELARLPGMKGLLDRDHNPLWTLGPDGDGAKAIIDFFQSTDPDTGLLSYDFTDTARDTRFLGDLYQNISESARKRYALLQTPDFIVDFILDRTLTPALDEFGLDGLRLIDPACGSGHFLLAAFERLFRLWASREGDLAVVVGHTLDSVYGVDLNPYAAAIARFRLLIAALRACGIDRLDRAPDWQIHVTTGDSLLFGPGKMVPSMTCLRHEDPEQLRLILQAQGYHVVVGNPPYINVQDPELRVLYRHYYASCSGQYQISVPFTELFFDVAERDGYVAMITSNAFMQKAFGRNLVTKYLSSKDLTIVVDTSGVHLDGFGTPTVMLFARKRPPVSRTLRVVRGIRGEVVAPLDPANAPVWTEIKNHTEQEGFEGTHVSVAESERTIFNKHPWVLGGGGASELKARLDKAASTRLASSIKCAGFASFPGIDEAFILNDAAAKRSRIAQALVRPLLTGDSLRDWFAVTQASALVPYGPDQELIPWEPRTGWAHWLWPFRLVSQSVVSFGGKTRGTLGHPWWGWYRWITNRYRVPLSISFSFVSTHAHFVLVPGGNVFKQTSPVIKLAATANKSDHLALLGILNSSAACFWLRQVCRNKGTGGIGGGLATELWEQFFEFDSTNVSQLPLPAGRALELATAIQSAADERCMLLPSALVAREVPTRTSLDAARDRADALLLRMIALQEELDWQVYHLYSLLDESLTLPIDQIPPVRLGERAFEILMARAMESGELETEWFARHRSTPRTDIPDHWPEPYRDLVQRRLDTIARDRDIALIEQPEYKRRWNLPPWERTRTECPPQLAPRPARRSALLAHNPPALTSVARLADAVRRDPEFLQVAELYRRRADFDLLELVEDLVAKESVPFLPVLRYKGTASATAPTGSGPGHSSAGRMPARRSKFPSTKVREG